MKKTLIGLGAILLLGGQTGTAGAIVVTVDDNLADNKFISAGQTLQGSFNINQALPADGQYVLPYGIKTASATFNFMDDGDLAYNGTSYGSYSVTSQYHSGNYYNSPVDQYLLTRATYDYFYDAPENATVQLSSFEVSTNGTNWYNTGATYDGSSSYFDNQSHYNTWMYSCGTWGTSTCTAYTWHTLTYQYTTNNYDQTTGYNGGFSMTMDLGPGSIADLSLDGILGFTVTPGTGDIIYQNGKLKADVTANPVPEPASMLLLGTGLASLAGFGRRRKKNAI